MPGGVSSPVRAFKSVGGEPVVFDRVKGAYAWDVSRLPFNPQLTKKAYSVQTL